MPVLTVDGISAKTLPALDNLYKTNPTQFSEIIKKTEGEPLVRLLLASIARQTFFGHPDLPSTSTTAQLLEVFIHNHLVGEPTEEEISFFTEPIDIMSVEYQQLMLKMSISRFNELAS